jgi:tripartite-type tricarboxylate transporter receptor subunit TctC
MNNALPSRAFARRVLCIAFALLATSSGAAAQSATAVEKFPIKPIRLIVPFAPGGPNDVMARVIAARMGANTGQAVIVENRAGAGGIIGTNVVAKSSADGYTLLFASGPFTMAPPLQPKMPYDAEGDFVAITKIAESPMVMMVPIASKFPDALSVVKYARENPGKVTYGSGGVGSTPHLTTELLASVTGARFLHVPYKGGGESIGALMGGEVDMLIDSVTSTASALASGRVKALAVTQDKRSIKLPNVPTFDEAGIKKFNMTHWVGVLAPKGTPPEVVSQLRLELIKALRSPEVEARYADMGAQPVGSSSEEFRKFIHEELQKWNSLAKSMHLKAE